MAAGKTSQNSQDQNLKANVKLKTCCRIVIFFLPG
uniref:Uncharacterized protein n=1 Tax=Anguilla anguilla TaxID=7936 RepID=A0A0E9UCQ5_ANGAN